MELYNNMGNDLPLVSIVIRTCGRPDVLKNALNSVKKQTYPKIEVVIVEDGMALSQKMINEKYSDMDIKYYSTGKKSGRSVVGNIGLAKANGEYINFLDDDDLFYENHIETLIKEIVKNKNAGAAYSIAEESQIKVLSQDPYKYKEKRIIHRYHQKYNKLLLFSYNYIPIQSILFKRKLYEKMGGFDEKLDYLEDWDIWVRYSTICDFVYVPVVTSKYFVPYKSRKKMKRNRELEKARKDLKKKFENYNVSMNLANVNEEMDYILYVHNKKGMYYYLKIIRDFILYRDM